MSSNDLPIFSLDEEDDSLVSEAIEDLEELLRIFFFFVFIESNKTALSTRENRRRGDGRFTTQSPPLSATPPLTIFPSGSNSFPVKTGFPNRPFLVSRPSDLLPDEDASSAAEDRKQNLKTLLLPLFFFLLSSAIAPERERRGRERERVESIELLGLHVFRERNRKR